MKIQMKRAIGVVEEIDAKQDFMEMEIEDTKAMTEVHRMVDCIILGTERLLMHQLTLCFTNVANLETAHTRLDLDAWQLGLAPVQPHITGYLEYETSFIIEHKILHIFVHVPLSDKKQNLELLGFYSIPIPISPTLQMQIDVKQSFLAISKGGLHTTIESSVIEKCSKYSEIHFCDKPLILYKKLQDTCLGSINMQNYTNLKAKCPAFFFKIDKLIEPFSAIFIKHFHDVLSNATNNPDFLQSRVQSAAHCCKISSATQSGERMQSIHKQIQIWIWIWHLRQRRNPALADDL